MICSALQYNTVQYSIVQYSTVQFSTVGRTQEFLMFYDDLCHVLPGSHYTLPVTRNTLKLIFVTNTGHYLDVEYGTLMECYNDLCHDIDEIL